MLLYITIIIVGVIIDQLSKVIAVMTLSSVNTIPIIPNVFHLTYVENTGAAFSLFEGMQGFLIVITLAFICLLCYILYILPKTKQYRLACFALSLMISGAIGNLIDRIRLSYVVDFFDFRIIGFAIFNVADILVVCGTILLAYTLLRNKNLFTERPTKKKSGNSAKVKTGAVIDEGYKDVLKDLKPKKNETKAEEVDITPEVKTNLQRLPSSKSVAFEPSPSLSYEIDEEEVKIYHPRSERQAPVTTVAPTRKVRRRTTELEVLDSQRIDIGHTNRYSRQTFEYEEEIQKQREETGEIRIMSNRNRYNESIAHYEESIKAARSENRRERKTQSVWDPRSIEKSTEKQEKEPSIWETGEIPRVERNTETRYEDMIDSYAALVQKTKATKKVKPSEPPKWENPAPSRKNLSSQPKKTTERTTNKEITDTQPIHKNRYTDSSDSYLRSIEEASKKKYTG